MKLKLTLARAGGQRQDLLVTADASTTVGELGRYLQLSDPTLRQQGGDAETDVTISVKRDGDQVLDTRTPLSDSPIRSGATISLARSGAQFTNADRDAVAMASVVEGPDAGKEFPLASGTNMIGRQRSCEVRLSDAMASRTHARVNVTDHIEVVDLGSANGVDFNGSLISREVVRPSDRVRIGDTVLTFRLLHVSSTEGRTDAASVGFIRPPRLAPRYEGREFEVPDVPQRSQPQKFPMTMLLMPILMAGVLYLATRQWQSILFAVLSPMMMIGSWWENRRQGRTADKTAIRAFRSDLADLVVEIGEEADREVATRLGEHPSTSQCLEACEGRRPLMWTRRPDDWGFLELRLGLGRLPSRSTLKPMETKNAPRDLVAEAKATLAHVGEVASVPVIATPRTEGGIGVAGARSAAISAARALVVQAAALHSPAELAVTVMASQRSTADWDWLKWLPHVDAPWSPVEARHLAATPSTATTLVTALETLIEARSAEDSASDVPAVLVLVESDAPVEFGRLVEISERGWHVGVHVLWVAPEVEQLPAACRTFVDTSSLARSGIGYVHQAHEVTPVETETVSAEDALAFARSIAPVIDLGARNEDSSDLPRTISFLAMDGYESLGDQPEAVIERWNQNHSILTGPRASEPRRREASLRAAVGHSAGHLHHLDLRTEGPHALVGGTTGAGKSEMLQAWILSMAANHSPQRLTFLLVDYKGGSAFAECSKLPHTVGMVTDLDANGVQRALRSLAAELKHREHVLDRAKAKDVMTMEKRWDPAAPPSLVIVVDEFAALVQEVPEFVDGVVNVAQRGRSLGLHLVLATQRPAGVIKDNLRANTNLRLALRVADEADSTDVLGSPDAAFFDPDLPGRAVSKTGPGRLVPFQTAYAGGHTGGGPVAPDIRVEELVLGSGARWEIAESSLPAVPVAVGGTDIARVVDTITRATAQAELPAPRKPWLEALAPVYDVRTLVRTDRPGERLPFGMVDVPDDQAQHPVSFEPDRSGNLAVYGASGAGKSTVLRTLAVSAGLGFRADPTWVYGMDFGAQGLAMLEPLPHVGSIVRGNDDERVRRLLRWLGDVVDERASRYSVVNAGTVSKYRQIAGRPEEPRILLVVDNLGGFLKAYESNDVWIDRLASIASAGRPLGVHLAVTSDRSGGLPTQLAATVQQRLVLRMPSLEEYDNTGVPRLILSPSSHPGRGIWDGLEVQAAVLGTSGDLGAQAREMAAMAAAMREAGAPLAPPIRRLPDLLPIQGLDRAVGEEVVLGVTDDTLAAMTILPEGTFAVTGPPSSGRTTALLTIASAVRRARQDSDLYLLTLDRRSRLLRQPIWTELALGLDAAAALADRLTERFAQEVQRPTVVVIERVAEWSDTLAELSVDLMIKALSRAGGLLVTDGEAVAYSRTYGLAGASNTSRVGFLLQPDPGDGSAFGATLPIRMNRGQFPSGRGFLVRGGRASLGQLALPDGPP
ncbi:MAG TPA: FtsK/SpoIIIE domain-containing protein [Ornithinibacter sp.]|mgnify:CR=1 FL=1|nr:FtsK/SpoIIIE domain-containing protein [Ornithinibacter sp.]